MPFHPATKAQSYLRLALIGPSGVGKTYSALRIAQAFGTRIAVIDTERGSASKYADEFRFQVEELTAPFSPQNYVRAIQEAIDGSYDVLIIDSLSQAWAGPGGVLEMHDVAAARDKSGNSYTAWRFVTPEHNKLIDAMLQAPLHVIATMRAKTGHEVVKGENGKMEVRKIGLDPIQRDGIEYEFDVVGELDGHHRMAITKTRCRALTDAIIAEPSAENPGRVLQTWLSDGVPLTLTDPQLQQIAAALKTHRLSVAQFLAAVNQALGTAYTNPREISQLHWPQVQAILGQVPVAPTDVAG